MKTSIHQGCALIVAALVSVAGMGCASNTDSDNTPMADRSSASGSEGMKALHQAKPGTVVYKDAAGDYFEVLGSDDRLYIVGDAEAVEQAKEGDLSGQMRALIPGANNPAKRTVRIQANADGIESRLEAKFRSRYSA